jgi:hypothetical protein
MNSDKTNLPKKNKMVTWEPWLWGFRTNLMRQTAVFQVEQSYLHRIPTHSGQCKSAEASVAGFSPPISIFTCLIENGKVFRVEKNENFLADLHFLRTFHG